MEGDLSLLSIPDLLQMICLGGYSRDIHLFDGPVQLGVIAIRRGRVERCFAFGAWGETAFYKLVTLRRGRYKVNEARDTGGADATLSTHSWQELLMEAARREDEAERVARSAATGRVIAFPTPAAHAAALELHAPAFELPPPPPVVMAHAASVSASGSAAVSASGSAAVSASGPASGSASAAAAAPIALPPIPLPAPPPALIAAAANPRRVHQTMELPGIDETGPAPSADFTRLMEEATASYLRRDLSRTEELLQQCLALRPGDKRVVQNLERVRRKKST